MITKLDLQSEVYPIPGLYERDIIPQELAGTLNLGAPVETRAAFAFERKGYIQSAGTGLNLENSANLVFSYISLDTLGRERNPRYSSDLDPFLVQSTWLVTADTNSWLLLKRAHNLALNNSIEKKRETLLAEQARIAKELEGLG